MGSIASIKSAVVDLLEAVDDLQAVYDHEPLHLPGLPCATVHFAGFDAERTEVNSLTVTYRYIVILYADLFDAANSESTMEGLIEQALDALAADPSLGGESIFSEIVRGEAYWVELVNRQRPLRAFEIEIAAIKEED